MSALQRQQLEQYRQDLAHTLDLYAAVRDEMRLTTDVIQHKKLKARAQQLEGTITTIETAIQQLETAIQTAPTLTAPEHLQRGEMRLRANDFAGAIADFKAVLVLQPQHSIAQNNLAAVYRIMGDYPAAIEAATHAIALNPRLREPWATRGAAYLALHDRRAMADLEQALRLDPQYDFAREKLAEAQQKFSR
jgi:tetratricopeptide (TPR) repeat protein